MILYQRKIHWWDKKDSYLYQIIPVHYTTSAYNEKIMSLSPLDDYLNYDHGLELVRGNTNGPRGNENGILYLCEYFILKQLSGQILDLEDKAMFEKIVDGLEVVPGLYDRGASDRVLQSPKRAISHDNIMAIASASKMLGTRHAADIASYGLKHFGIYNNNQKGFDLPMNPGNYSIWLALGNKSAYLQLLFLPFFIINFIITMFKASGDTSGRLVTLCALYPLRDFPLFDTFYGILVNNIKKKYPAVAQNTTYAGALSRMFAIYFKDPDHPNNVLARSL